MHSVYLSPPLITGAGVLWGGLQSPMVSAVCPLRHVHISNPAQTNTDQCPTLHSGPRLY